LRLAKISGEEDRALCGKELQTPPDPEGSSGKQSSLGAAGKPGWSKLS